MAEETICDCGGEPLTQEEIAAALEAAFGEDPS